MRELIVIGGGAAGLSAAISAYDKGIRDILIIERENELGGILNQCIHNGFGLHTFKEELTGPEFASRFIEGVKERNIAYILGAMVISLSSHSVTYVSSSGLVTENSKAIILAAGCRERPRGALNIPGFRPAGIFSAGTAQKLVNIDGYKVGKRVVILGSGDIGLIMARRLTLEGAKVLAVAEIMPYSGGLKRNIVQCLEDYSIPLYLSHTVIDIRGKHRVEGVTIAQVDNSRKPIPGTEIDFECDTLLLSVGLLPENELSDKAGILLSPVTNGPIVDDTLATSVDGIFAAGNVLHVHDLVDYVAEEAAIAGENAAAYILGVSHSCEWVSVKAGHGVRYTVPQKIEKNASAVTIRFRVSGVFKDAEIRLVSGGKEIKRVKRRILAPGEMEKITVNQDGFHEDLEVEVVE